MNVRTIDTFNLSLLQHTPTPADIESALTRLDTAASQAAANGSTLLVTPECGMTGYDMIEADCAISAFPADGPTAQRIANIAKKHSLSILYGFMEADGEQRYNSVQLIDANGQSLLHYRKTHLWGELDRNLFTEGNTLAPIVQLNGWNLGVLICYDVEFPETVRALTLAGAELILVPTALMHPWRFVAEQMVAVRAAENQVFLAYANLVGVERNTRYEGCSCIIGPDGHPLATAAGEGDAILHTSLAVSSLTQIRESVPYLHDRRPELYTSLMHTE